MGTDPHATAVYCVVTSYRIQAETTALVYRSLLAELERYRRVHNLVHRYFRSVAPGAGFVEDVMVGLEDAEAQRKRETGIE